VILLFIVTPLELLIVRLCRFATLEGISIPVAEPPKTSNEDAEVTRLEAVPPIAGPFSVKVYPPTVKVPDVRVSVPLRDRLAPSVMFLLIVKLLSPPEMAFRVIAVPVPIERFDAVLPVMVPPE
jgi:hypothetical protein